MEAGSSKILWRILPEQRLICSMVYLRLEISQFVKELTLSFSVVYLLQLIYHTSVPVNRQFSN